MSVCIKCGAQDRTPQDKCAPCRSAYLARWRAANQEKVKAYLKQWNRENVERVRQLSAKHYYADVQGAKERVKGWQKRNADIVLSRNAKRRAASKWATPAWADPEKIAAVYRLARLYTQWSGKQHSVDHIVPLKSKWVCGLHTHDNLRVMELIPNIQKGNRQWPDMGEPIRAR